MALIKDLQDKNYVGLKDYVGEKIATIVANKIGQKKEDFLNTVRGMSEKIEIVIKKDDDDDDKKDKKDNDKKSNPFAKKDEKPKAKESDDDDDDKPADKDKKKE